jgi:hypothetical protein
MGIEPGPAVVSVHVEDILSQAGEARAEELAAEGENELIIGKGELPACGCHCGGLSASSMPVTSWSGPRFERTGGIA